jgi:hypothetical protein
MLRNILKKMALNAHKKGAHKMPLTLVSLSITGLS